MWTKLTKSFDAIGLRSIRDTPIQGDEYPVTLPMHSGPLFYQVSLQVIARNTQQLVIRNVTGQFLGMIQMKRPRYTT